MPKNIEDEQVRFIIMSNDEPVEAVGQSFFLCLLYKWLHIFLLFYCLDPWFLAP